MHRNRFLRQTSATAPSPGKKITIILTLAALSTAAVGMSTLALLSSRADVAGIEDPAPPPSFEDEKRTAGVAPTPAQKPGSAKKLTPAPERTLAVGSRPNHLIRGAVGSCGAGAASLEVTSNGGATWQAASLTGLGDTQILSLDTNDPGVMRMVYLDSACSPQLARSFVGGTDWELTKGVEAAWYLNPTEPASANTPSGKVALPCSAVSLTATAERGIALCDDASVAVTEDFGASWSAPLAIAGAVAVALNGPAFAVATAGVDECAGVQTRTLVRGQLGAAGQCLSGEAPSGKVSLAGSAASGELYLWAGDRLARSVDGGTSWT